MPRPSWRDVRGYGIAVAIGLAGAWLALRSNSPLPWFLGPMIAAAAGSMLGLPMKGPLFLRPFALPILGVLLGSSFRPEIFEQIWVWSLSIAAVPVYVLLCVATGYAYFRFVAKYDPATSLYSSVPGGLNEMIMLGEQAGGDPVKIALAQSTRLLTVVLGVALVFMLLVGVSRGNAPMNFIRFAEVGPVDGSWLAFSAVAGVVLGRRLRLPVAAMLGPILLSALLHMSSVVSIGPPTLLTNFAQFTLGVCVGARFAGLRLRHAAGYMLHGTTVSVILLGVAAGFAFAIHALASIHPLEGLLAFAGGGMMEMSLLALAIGQSVAYVTVMHVLRFAFVMFSVPLLGRVLKRLTKS